jgi:tetratricopeptide (TPR) repeat protein
LLKYLYFEQDDWAKVLDILEILVRDFPKREYWVQLGQVYGQEGYESKQVYTYEAAHVAGYLDRESDMRNYAGLLMQSTVPYRAAKWLQKAIDEGIVEDTPDNLQSLGQAYQMAQEVDSAIPVFEKAGTKSDDGEILARLATLYLDKDEYKKCTDSAESALEKGGLRKPFNTQVIHGMCLFNRDRLTQARKVFVGARTAARGAKDRNVERICSRWVAHIDNEAKRRELLAAAD